MWKQILGFEGLYEVSRDGHIRSKRGVLKPHRNAKGYLRVDLWKNNIREHRFIHTEVMRAFVGERKGSLVIDHINFNKEDNSLSNLRYITNSENVKLGLDRKKLNESLAHSLSK